MTGACMRDTVCVLLFGVLSYSDGVGRVPPPFFSNFFSCSHRHREVCRRRPPVFSRNRAGLKAAPPPKGRLGGIRGGAAERSSPYLNEIMADRGFIILLGS